MRTTFWRSTPWGTLPSAWGGPWEEKLTTVSWSLLTRGLAGRVALLQGKGLSEKYLKYLFYLLACSCVDTWINAYLVYCQFVTIVFTVFLFNVLNAYQMYRQDKKGKLPKWIQEHLKDSMTNLSTEEAVQISKWVKSNWSLLDNYKFKSNVAYLYF